MYLINITGGNANSTLNNITATFDKHPWIVTILVFIVTLIISYNKNWFGLKIKVGRLFYIIKQFMVFVRFLPRLWIICEENSRNYISMIEFHLDHRSIDGEDSIPSPYLEFSFYISNFSMFDFEINGISMDAVYNDNVLKKLTNADIVLLPMKVPHQKQGANSAKLQPLPANFITRLKKLKAEGKELSVTIYLKNLKIDFIGDKKFSKSWNEHEKKLEIPMESIHVTL